jgi:hypothetical protein
MHLPEHQRWRRLPRTGSRHVVAILESHNQFLFSICQSVAIRKRVCELRQCLGLKIDYVQELLREKIREKNRENFRLARMRGCSRGDRRNLSQHATPRIALWACSLLRQTPN